MIQTNQGPMSAESIVDHLTYCSYAANRGYGMSAEALAKFWPKTGAAMEAKYQAEIAINNAARTSNDHATAASGDARASGGTNTLRRPI